MQRRASLAPADMLLLIGQLILSSGTGDVVKR